MMRNLIKKNQFKDQFIDRFAIYMGDVLNAEYGNMIIDSLANNIAKELPFHQRATYTDWINSN